MTRHVWSARPSWFCLTVCALLVAGCKGKDGKYFLPNPFGANPIDVTDAIPPTIENVRPATDIVLSDRYILADVFDGPGAIGQPITGLNPATLRASDGVSVMPFTRVGTSNTYNFDISATGEGRKTIVIEGSDFAGNRRTRSTTFTTDWSGPSVTFDGASSGSSNQSSYQANFHGTFGDPNGISAAVYYVRQPVNGQCSSAGTLYPTGTGPGMVSQNQFQLSATGTYNLDVTLYRPPNDQLPQTLTYCGHTHLEDAARDVNNSSKPNPTDRTWRYDVTWAAMPPSSGTVTGRVTVNTTSPLPGITVSIPGRSTTTDANGNYSFADVPAGGTPVTISNVPADVHCPTLSQTRTVTAGQAAVADFNCLRLNVSNYTTTAQGTVRNDPSGHEPFLHVTNISSATVKILPNNGIELTYGITMTGAITRLPDGTLTFTANGSGTISGRTATGTFTSGIIEAGADGKITKVTGIFTFGTQGQLPGGQSVSYDVVLTAPVPIP